MKLIQRGAMSTSDMFVQNNDLDTPLHLAVSRLNMQCAKHILNAMKGRLRNIKKKSSNSSNNAFYKLIKSQNKKGLSPLRMVMRKQAEVTDPVILSECTDLLWMMNSDLHWQQVLIESIRTGDEAGCMNAIDNGARANGDGDPFRPMNEYDPDEKQSQITTTIHVAATSSHGSVIELLLSYVFLFHYIFSFFFSSLTLFSPHLSQIHSGGKKRR